MELIIQVAVIQLLECCSFEGNSYEVGGVIPVLDTGI